VCDVLLSSFAFKFNLRRYNLAVESDNTSVFYVARAMHLLQKVTGAGTYTRSLVGST
jgi:hypothetical protein